MPSNNIIAGASVILKCVVNNGDVILPNDFTAHADIYTYTSKTNMTEATKLSDIVNAVRNGNNSFELDINPSITSKFTSKTNVVITVESGDKSHIIKKIVRFKVERF